MGPVCPYALAPVARFSGKWKIPVLSTGGQAPAFRKKSDYPLLTTMGGNYRMFGVFFAKLLRRYAWEKFAFLPHVYPEISKKGGSSCEFSLNDIWSVYKEGKKTYEQPFYEPLHEDRLNSTEIKALLERVKDKARGKNFLFFWKKKLFINHLELVGMHSSFLWERQTNWCIIYWKPTISGNEAFYIFTLCFSGDFMCVTIQGSWDFVGRRRLENDGKRRLCLL